MSERTHDSALADARAKALEFLADRDTTRAALDGATAQIRELRESVAALIVAGHRDHEAELSEALGRKRSRYDTWRTLLEVVRERLDRSLEEKLRRIVGENGKPDRAIPLPQLLDDIRWYAHVVTPERNELMEQQRQLLDVLSAKNVLTIVDDARRIVEERKRLSHENERLRAAIEAVGDELSRNGCDCDCDHIGVGDDEHDADCERCFACRVQRALNHATESAR